MLLFQSDLFLQKVDNEDNHCKPSLWAPHATCSTSYHWCSWCHEWMFQKARGVLQSCHFSQNCKEGFRILKFWGDQVNINLKNLGTGMFWALPAGTKPLITISNFWKFWPKLTTDVYKMGHTYSSLYELRYLCRNSDI